MTERGAFPNRVVGEQTGDAVGIVLVVAQRCVARFQIADRFRVLQRPQSALYALEPRRVRSTVSCHMFSPNLVPPSTAVRSTRSPREFPGHEDAPPGWRLSDITRPSFRTSWRSRTLVTSSSGLPPTTIRSASLPS